MLSKRAVAEELGGFDEDFFMHMEEIDLSWRMMLAGYRVQSVPSSVVLHEGGASLQAGSAEKIYFNHRNNVTMLLKNRSVTALVWILPLRLLLEFAAALFYLTQFPGGMKKSGAVFRALACNIRRFTGTMKKRRMVQSLRVVDDRTIFRHAPLSLLYRN